MIPDGARPDRGDLCRGTTSSAHATEPATGAVARSRLPALSSLCVAHQVCGTADHLKQADQALKQFEIDMGLVTPETAGVKDEAKELGAAQKQTQAT